jgi:hypothetical protein
MENLIYNINNLHLIDSTITDEESYYLLNSYIEQKKDSYHIYTYPDFSLKEIYNLINAFCLFFAYIKDIKENKKYISNVPLGVFRYILLEDLTSAPYYAVKRKSGYIVEGMYWSNGVIYQVREDKKEDFEIHQIVLILDSLTKRLHNYPDSELCKDYIEKIFNEKKNIC